MMSWKRHHAVFQVGDPDFLTTLNLLVRHVLLYLDMNKGIVP
jgi:hypothetical protein